MRRSLIAGEYGGGHAYPFKNDVRPDFFTVRTVSPNDPRILDIAWKMQAVQHDAWVAQLDGRLTAEDIEKDVNPDSSALVHTQVEKVRDDWHQYYNGVGPYIRPQLVIAEAIVPTEYEGDTRLDIVGYGEGVETRPTGYDSPHFTVANMFVGSKMQDRGIGAAMVRELLDDKPPNAKTRAINYRELNPKTHKLLECLGFVAAIAANAEGESIRVIQFGKEIESTVYKGGEVQEAIAGLEGTYPHLKNRVPFSAHSIALYRP
jgi:GNAT superfamily N-acetyltransferase